MGRCGRRDEELEEAGREMSAAAGSRDCDSAGLWRAVGSWAGARGGEGRRARASRLGRARSAVWPVDARGKDQGPGPSEAGTLGLKFRGDIILRRRG